MQATSHAINICVAYETALTRTAAAKYVGEAEAITRDDATGLVLARAKVEGNSQERAAAYSEAENAFNQAETNKAGKTKASPRKVSAALRSGKRYPDSPRLRRAKFPKSKHNGNSSLSRKAIRKGKGARDIAIKIVINALEEAGYSVGDHELKQLFEDLE